MSPAPAYVDLHVHTDRSDGSDSPAEVVERAVAAGFAGLAVTDHDTVDGVEDAELAVRERLEFLRGVEISAHFGSAEVHVVGLGVDVRHPTLLEALKGLQEMRAVRVAKMVERLNRLGIDITLDEVRALAPSSALGRIHVARVLAARGATRSVQQAFDKFIKSGKKAYVPNETVSCQRAIDIIHLAGGVAILAHPGIGSSTSRILDRLLRLPFDGLEVYHSKHTPGQVTQFTQIALERDLLISGGSDCHGTALGSNPDLGKVRIPFTHFDRIRETIRRGR